MTPEEILAKFAHSLDNFKPIVGQTSDSDLTILLEAVAPLLLQIPYDETGEFHNLICLIRLEAAYVARYGEAFPEPARVGAYDKTIDDNSTAVVRARTKAAHKANLRNGATGYNSIRSRRRLQHLGPRTTRRRLYLHQGFPEGPISHLQAGCTGRHVLVLLEFHNEMQRYHLKVKGIPEYINMLKDAQRQAGRAGRTIPDETLLLFAN